MNKKEIEDFKCDYCSEHGCDEPTHHEMQLVIKAKQEVFDRIQHIATVTEKPTRKDFKITELVIDGNDWYKEKERHLNPITDNCIKNKNNK